MAPLLKSLLVFAALLALHIITLLVKPHIISAILDAFDESENNGFHS